MKTISIKKIAWLLAINFSICSVCISQTNYQSHSMDISLTGTSTLHDWEMKAATGKSEAEFTIGTDGTITSLSKLSFTLPAVSLKSGHTAMDKNTYKALKTADNPNISFVLTTATVTSKGSNNYLLTCTGAMSIAGTVKQTDLEATATYDPADKSFTVTGVKKMKMTDYNVKPPTVMLGTIKTGNAISIAYNLKFTR
ncbi:MAG: YceI family protein [Ginsengibacter sp.]